MTTTPKQDPWIERLRSLASEALGAVSGANSLDELEAARVKYLGRKDGGLNLFLKELKDFSVEERRLRGPEANARKAELEGQIKARREAFERSDADRKLGQARIDWSLPAAPAPLGRRHPITVVLAEMTSILSTMGFVAADGPLAETDHYNFEALNIPADHPARDMQDTFYLAGQAGLLLRTHTSPVQIRFMEKHAPPIRIMAPGRVFRHEAVDASHSAVFHQVEGLYVDKGVTMANLKGTLREFLKRLLGASTETRFRPSYFPFTEPSAEVDVRCLFCSGKGCGVCKRSGWLEMLGCGMVHPEVLKALEKAGADPAQYSGYAFGIGVERIAMLRLGIPDIRMFYENDLRFLEQFG